MTHHSLENLAAEAAEELTENILPFWMDKMQDPAGGFYGRIAGNGELDTAAPKGAIMNARLLWTFSNAYRIFNKDGKNSENAKAETTKYLETATRAKREIIDRFYDPANGGIWWSLTPDGKPADTKKQIYAIAFAIYGLAEYSRATSDKEALDYAIRLFNDIEEHSFDPILNGYFEAFTEDWGAIGDMRLSDKDANESKTMNTHLHILEAYTGLFRIWKDERLHKQLKNLILIFTGKILGKDGHLRLFFDEQWNCGYDIISYGHDIEASWLLHEAAMVLDDKEVLSIVEQTVQRIAAAAGEGFSRDGGMIYEKENGVRVDGDRHWWVQAETVVGYLNIWQHFSDTDALENALAEWDFIRDCIIDREGGEWFWSLRADGTVNRDDDKAGFWKCPYHNGRMCMEIIERA